jgi:hypothetical protein
LLSALKTVFGRRFFIEASSPADRRQREWSRRL